MESQGSRSLAGNAAVDGPPAGHDAPAATSLHTTRSTTRQGYIARRPEPPVQRRTFTDPQITMAHGAGGSATRRLIEGLFLPELDSAALTLLDDAATFQLADSGLAMTTDTFVVRPIRFPGGSIGALAVNGTVNDIAVVGARPIAITLSMVLEEGLHAEELIAETRSIAMAARRAGVVIVAGDTKVVERGRADRMYICTTGLGHIDRRARLSPRSLRPGDRVLVSGCIGNHGTAIMVARGDLTLDSAVESDTLCLWPAVDSLLDAVGDSLRCMRDASRGGVASVLHALANASCVGVAVDEASIPVRTPVADACAILGVHPLHVASEGRLVAIVARAAAERALEALRSIPGCDDAADIGEVVAGEGGPLLLRSASGALRGLDLEGVDRLTRLC